MFVMNSLLSRLSISVLLLGSAAAACADQPTDRGESRSRGERLKVDRFETERSTRSEETRNNRDDEVRPARMSPEQRRALRQQINEAGQDIYQPKR